MTEEQKQEQLRRIRLPHRDELEQFALVTQLLGVGKIRAMAEDGVERICRIPGKMKKRVWLRDGDLIIIQLWDFQPSKANVSWRYLGYQLEYLKRKGLLGKLPV